MGVECASAAAVSLSPIDTTDQTWANGDAIRRLERPVAVKRTGSEDAFDRRTRAGTASNGKTSYKDALDQSRGNPFSAWPSRESNNRLEPIACPSFETGVRLQDGAKVVTMGSCFARNIEEFFEAEGFNVPLMGYSAPPEEYGQGGRIQGILNKYTLASIAMEVEWLARVRAEGGVVTAENIDHMLLAVKDDRFIDLQLASAVPVSRERAIERRQQIFDIHVQIFDCDLAVLTPGLTETWYDCKTGYHIQRIPSPRQAKLHPDRFTFEVMDFFTCFDMLDRTIRTLKANNTRQIALTVSPVPLQKTMTGQDVLIANAYSKSTLRSVVGAICERHEGVFYIPSYERVVLTKDPEVWRPDLRHVADDFVGAIASSFASVALGRSVDVMHELLDFERAVEDGRINDAEAALQVLGAKALNTSLHTVVKSACRLHMAAGRWSEALPFASRLVVLRPQVVSGYKLEYRILHRLKDAVAAQDCIARAIKHCKNVSEQDFLQEPDKSG